MHQLPDGAKNALHFARFRSGCELGDEAREDQQAETAAVWFSIPPLQYSCTGVRWLSSVVPCKIENTIRSPAHRPEPKWAPKKLAREQITDLNVRPAATSYTCSDFTVVCTMKPKRQGPSLASFVNNRSSTYTGFQAKKLREKQQNSKKVNKYRRLLKHLGSDPVGRYDVHHEGTEDMAEELASPGDPDEPRAPPSGARTGTPGRSGKHKSRGTAAEPRAAVAARMDEDGPDLAHASAIAGVATAGGLRDAAGGTRPSPSAAPASQFTKGKGKKGERQRHTTQLERNARGQPVMKYRIEALLDKIKARS
eukprot:jgi/Mesvir1/17384/Mv08685-RA.1